MGVQDASPSQGPAAASAYVTAPAQYPELCVPEMPLFEPSRDPVAADVLRSARKEYSGVHGAGFTFPADEVFWANFVSEAGLDPESAKAPRYKVYASHTTMMHRLNREWMQAYVRAWEIVNPHYVTVTYKAEEKAFRASAAFWARVRADIRECAAKAKPGERAAVSVRATVPNGTQETLLTTHADWARLCRAWEEEMRCSRVVLTEYLKGKGKGKGEGDSREGSPASQPASSPLSAVPASSSSHASSVYTARPNADSERRSTPSQRIVPVRDEHDTPLRTVVAARDIFIRDGVVGVRRGTLGEVLPASPTSSESSAKCVVRWAAREDGAAQPISVKQEWLRPQADQTPQLQKVFNRAATGFLPTGRPMMSKRDFARVFKTNRLLTTEEAYQVFDWCLQHGHLRGRSGLHYDAFRDVALPRACRITHNPCLTASLLDIPAYSAGVHHPLSPSANSSNTAETQTHLRTAVHHDTPLLSMHRRVVMGSTKAI